MQYRFTNITGRTSLTDTPNTAVLTINRNTVRPEETRLFFEPTQDVLAAMEAKSILVEINRAGSWVALRSLAEFEGFSITRTERQQRVVTVDGFRTSTVVEFDIRPATAPIPPPEPAPIEVPAEVPAEAPVEESRDETVEEEVTEDVVEDVVEEEAPAAASSDFSAKDAVAYINDHDLDALDGFVGDDETRKSVLKAWEAKFD